MRSIPRRVLPGPLWHKAQFLKLRAAHLPMRVTSEGRASRERLAAYRDAHQGETCAILGNGPSIKDLDLEDIEGIPTFCLNRGYLLWEDAERTPDYYVAVNELVIEQFHREIATLPCPIFVPWIYRDRFEDAPNSVFFETRIDDRFVTNPLRGIAPGPTVTIAALQFAYHMGFSTVILLGIDHRFETEGPPHAEIRQNGDDPNHFRGDYFGEGTRWNLPDLEHSERGYALAREAFEAGDRQVLNATPGSALDVFERIELQAAVVA